MLPPRALFQSQGPPSEGGGGGGAGNSNRNPNPCLYRRFGFVSSHTDSVAYTLHLAWLDDVGPPFAKFEKMSPKNRGPPVQSRPQPQPLTCAQPTASQVVLCRSSNRKGAHFLFGNFGVGPPFAPGHYVIWREGGGVTQTFFRLLHCESQPLLAPWGAGCDPVLGALFHAVRPLAAGLESPGAQRPLLHIHYSPPSLPHLGGPLPKPLDPRMFA